MAAASLVGLCNCAQDTASQAVKDGLSISQLLCNKSSNTNHGKATVVDLLGLHIVLLLGVLGKKTKGVKAKVAWLVVIPQGVELAGGGVVPSHCHTV